MQSVKPYIEIARPDHWFKNIFMLPGIGLALVVTPERSTDYIFPSLYAFIALCLFASANYTINEWLDAQYDSFHPTKKNRPSVVGHVKAPLVLVQYVLLLFAGFVIAYQLSMMFVAIAAIFAIMGLVYNVPPVRTKDVAYLDVLTEAVNNPLRLLMGWAAVLPDSLPPSSIILSYWMGGAFLMGIKRFAEYRFIDNAKTASSYRKSFTVYTADTLLLSSFFYALCASFFLAIFLIKYRIEFLLSFPLFAALFTWYLALGLRSDSPTQSPENLFGEKRFIAFVIFLSAVVALLFFVDLPWLNILVTRLQYS